MAQYLCTVNQYSKLFGIIAFLIGYVVISFLTNQSSSTSQQSGESKEKEKQREEEFNKHIQENQQFFFGEFE